MNALALNETVAGGVPPVSQEGSVCIFFVSQDFNGQTSHFLLEFSVVQKEHGLVTAVFVLVLFLNLDAHFRIDF